MIKGRIRWSNIKNITNIIKKDCKSNTLISQQQIIRKQGLDHKYKKIHDLF